MKFKEVLPQLNLPELEKRILKFWEENKVLEKYLKKNENSKRRFSFLDGPITANNPMGVHHGWGRTLKDLYQRYKNMQGFFQRFQNGFDNQGLWIEVEVEKKLGFKSKKDIEEYGIARFVEKCKEHTLLFAKVQTEQSKRLGYFMDWENSYYTMSDENNYAIWHFLKKCWRSGWLYKGEDVVPWCSRCGTAISQHEILTGDYADIVHKAVYLKYPVSGKKNEYCLVWTTTPWTLPANVAIAYNPEVIYVRLKSENGQILILAKAQLSVIKEKYKILKEFPGEKLSGLKYQGLFDELSIVRKNVKEHQLVPFKEGVLEKEGTGLVHLSPGSGPEDYDLAKMTGLAVFPVLDENGRYVQGYDQFEGKEAAKMAETLIDYLSEKKSIYKSEDFKHRYPLCWRCRTELLFRLVDEWYIAMDELRPKMMTVAKKIHWIPEFGLKLELDWLKNMEDWLISKKRYWGLALPIFECGCGHFEVIGSKKELKERAREGWERFEGHSPHRPWLDGVKIECPGCKKLVSRIPDVGNPWLDAGIVSFSTLKYFEDKEYWKEWFPADLVLESFLGQFKNWFYSLIAMATALENTNPFKTLLGHALVRDEKGREMHKSWGNAIEFNEAAEVMGADSMRWMYISQNPATNLNFGFGLAKEIQRRFFLILWNCQRFFIDYAGVDKIKPEEIGWADREGLSILDRWILSKMNNLVARATQALDDYQAQKALQALEDFVLDFSTWYIRRSRQRIGPAAPDEKDKKAFYQTSWWVLNTLMRLLAPFLPFLSEEMFQNLGGRESIHLQDWPRVYQEFIDGGLESQMDLVRNICSLGHSLRREAGIRVRQPLSELWLNPRAQGPGLHAGKAGLETENELLDLIKEELNVKEVKFVNEIKAKDGWFVKEEQGLALGLNLQITSTLRQEGMVREVVRTIQDMRKKAFLKPVNEIFIWASGPQSLAQALGNNKKLILKETIARDLRWKKKRAEGFDLEKRVKIGSEDLWLAIKKI